MAEPAQTKTVGKAKSDLAHAVRYRDPEAVAAARADLETAKIVRALDDPVALARAATIVRAALNRGRLARGDLAGDAP